MSSESVKRRKVIELLFSKFAVAYRHLWRKEFQDPRYSDFAKREWEKHLQDFSDAVITKVTEHCEKYHERPPMMAQFVGLCKNEVNRNFVKKKEPMGKASPETAAYHLKKIKEILLKRR